MDCCGWHHVVLSRMYAITDTISVRRPNYRVAIWRNLPQSGWIYESRCSSTYILIQIDASSNEPNRVSGERLQSIAVIVNRLPYLDAAKRRRARRFGARCGFCLACARVQLWGCVEDIPSRCFVDNRGECNHRRRLYDGQRTYRYGAGNRMPKIFSFLGAKSDWRREAVGTTVPIRCRWGRHAHRCR